MNNLNKIFWNNYYTNTNDDIKNNSSFSEFVYSNFIKIYNENNRL
jgi:hypothetical protein